MQRGALTAGFELRARPVRHQTARPSPTLRSNLGARSPVSSAGGPFLQALVDELESLCSCWRSRQHRWRRRPALAELLSVEFATAQQR